MSIRRPNDPTSSPLCLRRLGLVSVAVLGVALGACASATVGDVGSHDAAATGGSGGGGSSGGSGGKGGNAGGSGGGGGGSSGLCDPIANTGCGSGQKCTALQSSGGLSLGCDSKGSKAEGDTCNQVTTGSAQTDDDCGSGLACFKVGTETTATCHRICPTSGSACVCSGDQLCSLTIAPLNSSGYAFCRAVAKCNPLDQTTCSNAGEACFFSTSSCYTGPLCARAGSKKPGEACAVANECQTGSTCLIIGNSGTCTAFCSTDSGGSPSCSGGDTCAPLGGSDPKVGSCRSS